MKKVVLDLTKLLPCPFCGGKDLDLSIKVFGRRRDKASYHTCIFCKSCNCYGMRSIVSTNNTCLSKEEAIYAKELAVKAWNTRG